MSTGVAAFLAMVGALVLIPVQHLVLDWPFANWLIDLGTLLAFIVIVGIVGKGRLEGVLIDERNKMSLSRLQTVLWSVVIIGSMVAFALIRLKAGALDPLNVSVPDALLVAVGITTTALAGSPIIRSVKEQSEKRPNADQVRDTGIGLGLSGEPRMRGLIVVNETPAAASWMDMLRGEEGGNAAALDIGKIQMFWFTGLLVAAYLVMIGAQITTGANAATVVGGLDGLPEISPAFVTLLGIANGAYLANKAVPHTATQRPG
jgi:hypothetical protein